MRKALLSAAYRLEGEDAASAGEAVFREWSTFMQRYLPSVSKTNGQAVLGYLVGKLTVEVLKNCGDDLSRENIMRQARLLKGIQLPMMVQGIMINTSPSDHAPIEQMRMMRFTNGQWQHFGPVRSGVDAGAVSESFKTIFKYGTATKRDLANQLNANTVSLMTGSFGSTYAQVGADLASVLDNGTALRILPVMGRGSVQAVSDILLLRGVDAGIVRKDTLSYLDRKDFAKDIRNQFVYVAKMFNEEMHVLAPRTIASMKDLDGKTVVVDLPDSSTFVTAINVFDRLGIRPHLIYQEPRLAVDMLRKGEVDAIVAIEGKPLQWLNQINDRNLHLVPVEYAKPLQEEYLPSKLSLGGLPEPGGGGWLRRDDRRRGACWRRTTGRRTATATAACRCWWTRCSTRSRSCSVRRSIRSGRKWRHARRCPAGPASRRRRNGSTATCRCPRARRSAASGAAPAPACCCTGRSPCPAGPRSAVSRIPGMAGQPRQGQRQPVIGPADIMV